MDLMVSSTTLFRKRFYQTHQINDKVEISKTKITEGLKVQLEQSYTWYEQNYCHPNIRFPIFSIVSVEMA